MRKKGFWPKAIIANLAAILAIALVLAIFLLTPLGRLATKTLLLTSEVAPGFPIKPLKLITPAPKMEEVEIKVGDKTTKASLYRPQDQKSHPGVVINFGATVVRNSGLVNEFSQSLSRSGFVVLVPESSDFLAGFVWTDSVETMISSVEYLEKQDFVDKKRIGFVGFCVGASVSIIAAEDEKIADKVSFIAAASPYFDLISLSRDIITKQTEDSSGKNKAWTPADLSVMSVQKGFINFVPNEEERKLLSTHFLEEKNSGENDINSFSSEAAYVYSFLSAGSWEKANEILGNLSENARKKLLELSPGTKIASLKAKLFILNDKVDTFVPKIEGEKFAKSLSKEQIYFVEIDSFEHVSPKTRLTRWAAIKQLFHLGNYLYRVLSEVENGDNGEVF